MSASVLELASKTIAAILVLIKAIKVRIIFLLHYIYTLHFTFMTDSITLFKLNIWLRHIKNKK